MNLYKLVPKDPSHKGLDEYEWCGCVIVAAETAYRAKLADPVWAWHNASYTTRNHDAVMCPLESTGLDGDGEPMYPGWYQNSWPSDPAHILVIPLAYNVPIDVEGIVCHDFSRI